MSFQEVNRGVNAPSLGPIQLNDLSINTVRFLSVEAVEKTKSGHPDLPMGAAPMVCILWMQFFKHNPANPGWLDHDGFVLSAGHGAMLI